MKNINRKIILISAVIILVIIMVYNSLSQPGIKDLKTNFKEITAIRNEQNTGPIIRYYIVTVDRMNKMDIKTYGDFMPHTKYGNTRVYFFDKNKPFPNSVGLFEPYFDAKFNRFCVAVYEKSGMGDVEVKDF